MKRLFSFMVLLVGISLIVLSCGQEQKAKKLIREEFKETLNDYKSYEPVSYGTLTPIYRMDKEVLLSPQQELQSAQDDYASWTKLSEEYKNEYGEDSQKYLESLEVLALMEERLNEAEQLNPKLEQKPKEVIGWTMDHKYRARVPAGGFRLFVTRFSFDKNMTMVLSTKDLTD